jgi:hypothetical protein
MPQASLDLEKCQKKTDLVVAALPSFPAQNRYSYFFGEALLLQTVV